MKKSKFISNMNHNFIAEDRLSKMSISNDYDSTPTQNPFKVDDKLMSHQPKINNANSFENLSDMSSCESNEFSNMDEKINLGLKQGNIPKNLVLRNSIFKSNIMKPKTKIVSRKEQRVSPKKEVPKKETPRKESPRREFPKNIRLSKSLNPPVKSAEKTKSAE